jgi:hypothetical protein
VTGKKALFVNRQFTRRIVGLKQEESEAILNLLYNHIQQAADCQARVRWRPRTVVAWDNRRTVRFLLLSFPSPMLTSPLSRRLTPPSSTSPLEELVVTGLASLPKLNALPSKSRRFDLHSPFSSFLLFLPSVVLSRSTVTYKAL